MSAGGGVDAARVAEVWQQEASHVLAALVRHFGDFEACEDAAQEALEAALAQWPVDGVPAAPRGWLIRVASRRFVDRLRSDGARARRERLVWTRERAGGEAGDPPAEDADDTLTTLSLCCHPALTPETQAVLSLRAVAGLTTARIADVFFMPEATVAQRISRAKSTIRRHGSLVPLGDADADGDGGVEASARLAHILRALYLMFTQGHLQSRGDDLTDPSVSTEAIRLTRELRRACPDDSEVAGLLALMLLTEARRDARLDAAGDLVPLAEQDRDVWDRALIAEGVGLIEWSLPRGQVGPYQVQAAIAAVHDDAPTWASTDWPQILVLYGILDRIEPSPTVALNRAVAVSMIYGPERALAGLDAIPADSRVRSSHRFASTRAHLLAQSGRPAEAREAFLDAARRSRSGPERTYLARQAERLGCEAGEGG